MGDAVVAPRVSKLKRKTSNSSQEPSHNNREVGHAIATKENMATYPPLNFSKPSEEDYEGPWVELGDICDEKPPSQPLEIPVQQTPERASIPAYSPATPTECFVCKQPLGELSDYRRTEHVNQCLDKLSHTPTAGGPRAETKREDMSCMVCHKNLNHLTVQARLTHINRCCDNQPKAPPIAPTMVSTDDAVGIKGARWACPICGHNLDQANFGKRVNHLKSCGKKHGVAAGSFAVANEASSTATTKKKTKEVKQRTIEAFAKPVVVLDEDAPVQARPPPPQPDDDFRESPPSVVTATTSAAATALGPGGIRPPKFLKPSKSAGRSAAPLKRVTGTARPPLHVLEERSPLPHPARREGAARLIGKDRVDEDLHVALALSASDPTVGIRSNEEVGAYLQRSERTQHLLEGWFKQSEDEDTIQCTPEMTFSTLGARTPRSMWQMSGATGLSDASFVTEVLREVKVIPRASPPLPLPSERRTAERAAESLMHNSDAMADVPEMETTQSQETHWRRALSAVVQELSSDSDIEDVRRHCPEPCAVPMEATSTADVVEIAAPRPGPKHTSAAFLDDTIIDEAPAEPTVREDAPPVVEVASGSVRSEARGSQEGDRGLLVYSPEPASVIEYWSQPRETTRDEPIAREASVQGVRADTGGDTVEAVSISDGPSDSEHQAGTLTYDPDEATAGREPPRDAEDDDDFWLRTAPSWARPAASQLAPIQAPPVSASGRKKRPASPSDTGDGDHDGPLVAAKAMNNKSGARSKAGGADAATLETLAAIEVALANKAVKKPRKKFKAAAMGTITSAVSASQPDPVPSAPIPPSSEPLPDFSSWSDSDLKKELLKFYVVGKSRKQMITKLQELWPFRNIKHQKWKSARARYQPAVQPAVSASQPQERDDEANSEGDQPSENEDIASLQLHHEMIECLQRNEELYESLLLFNALSLDVVKAALSEGDVSVTKAELAGFLQAEGVVVLEEDKAKDRRQKKFHFQQRRH